MRGIVFPGAHFSVYQDLPWIDEFVAFIRSAFHEHPHVKLVGICFGHQAISTALGGKVERMTDYLEKSGMPLFMGKEELKLKDPKVFLQGLPYTREALSSLSEDQALTALDPFVLNSVHGDHVAVLPLEISGRPEFRLEACSVRTPHELWTFGDQVLCMQAHPELTAYLMQRLIIDRLSNLGRLSPEQKARAETLLHEGPPLFRHVMLRIIARFLLL